MVKKYSHFFNGAKSFPVETYEGCKDIVKHGASQSVKEFMAGQFSGTTPVTDGRNMNKYDNRKLDPNDLTPLNNFNPEIEDLLRHKKAMQAKQAALIEERTKAAQEAQLSHNKEFEKYKAYFEQNQKKQIAE